MEIDEPGSGRFHVVEPSAPVGDMADEGVGHVRCRPADAAGDQQGNPRRRIPEHGKRRRLEPARGTIGDHDVALGYCRVERPFEQHFKRAVHARRRRAKGSARNERAGRETRQAWVACSDGVLSSQHSPAPVAT